MTELECWKEVANLANRLAYDGDSADVYDLEDRLYYLLGILDRFDILDMVAYKNHRLRHVSMYAIGRVANLESMPGMVA